MTDEVKETQTSPTERVGLNVTYNARRMLNLVVAKLELATGETWNQSKAIEHLIDFWEAAKK